MTQYDRHERDTIKMLSNPPQFRGLEHGVPVPLNLPLRVEVAQSRRYTTAIITWDGITIASGVAKRHPKDHDNPAVGQAIALSRAFAVASQEYSKRVVAWTKSEYVPAPDDEAVKALRKQNRLESKRRKDARRLEARERYERENPDGWRERVFDRRGAA